MILEFTAMACNDKGYEIYNKNDWMKKLENIHIQRTDMNKLIMNYLVTGTYYKIHIPY